jgi:hypothetical protein
MEDIDVFILRNYFKIEEILKNQLNRISSNVCDMRWREYIRYCISIVCDTFFNERMRPWFELFVFIEREFKETLNQAWFNYNRICNTSIIGDYI